MGTEGNERDSYKSAGTIIMMKVLKLRVTVVTEGLSRLLWIRERTFVPYLNYKKDGVLRKFERESLTKHYQLIYRLRHVTKVGR